MRRPDFLWLAQDSLYLTPVLIEIEAPEKKWVTKTGQQHSQLTQALHQLQEWEEWFDNPANRAVFLESYAIPSPMNRKTLEPIFVLIYGRSNENAEMVVKLRRRLNSQTQFVIPYEHLDPDPQLFGYISARVGVDGYEAVGIPPTLTLGPGMAEYHGVISGKEAAADKSEWLSSARRDFLRRRFSYWDEWGRGDHGIVSPADEE